MDNVIKHLNSILVIAAKNANIDVDPISGFDGDAWVWVWRKDISEGADKRAQVTFRAQPDSFYERISTEVFAHAWKEKRRQVSWSMTYAAEVLEMNDFKTEVEERLTPRISQLLSKAWKDVLQQAKRLDNLQDRQEYLQKKLRSRNLLDA